MNGTLFRELNEAKLIQPFFDCSLRVLKFVPVVFRSLLPANLKRKCSKETFGAIRDGKMLNFANLMKI